MANKNGFFKLELLLLSVLSQHDCYGYQLTMKIKQITNGTIVIKDGTLYPILYKLLDRQYISTYEERVGKKIRVYYHIEPLGKEMLEEMINEFKTTVNYIYDVINYKGEDNHEK